MSRYLTILAIFPLLLFALSCTSESEPAESREAEPQTSAAQPFDMNAYWDEYEPLSKSEDTDQMLSYFADDVILMESFQPAIRGIESVRQMMDSVYSQIEVVDFNIQSEETRMAGDWLLDRGTFSETFQPPQEGAEPISITGKYMAVLERASDGEWKISRLIANSNQPPSPDMIEMMSQLKPE